MSAAVEHFHLTAQAPLEEREFNTHVEVTILFPRNLLITQEAWYECQATVAILEGISGGVEVIFDTIVTLFTIRGLEFEFVHPLHVEEALLRDDPRTREAPEVAPAVIRMEARRSIATERSRSEIAIEEAIVGTCKPAFGVVESSTRRGRTIFKTATKFVVLVVYKIGAVARQRVALRAIVLMTHESFHIVDASKRAGVVEELLEVVAHTKLTTH